LETPCRNPSQNTKDFQKNAGGIFGQDQPEHEQYYSEDSKDEFLQRKLFHEEFRVIFFVGVVFLYSLPDSFLINRNIADNPDYIMLFDRSVLVEIIVSKVGG
jgi:hypothetical protein